MATSFLRKKLVDLLTGNGSYVSPTLYLALFSADPGDSGSLASEIAGGGYARQSLAGKMGAADATTGLSLNTSTVTFPVATLPWSIVALGFTDALTGVNVIQAGRLSAPKIIAAGGLFQLVPGQIKFRIA